MRLGPGNSLGKETTTRQQEAKCHTALTDLREDAVVSAEWMKQNQGNKTFGVSLTLSYVMLMHEPFSLFF